MTSETSSSTASFVPVPRDSYSALFPLYEDADIVLRSSDGVLLATEKLYLQAASSVFYDIVKMGREGEIEDGLPVLRLQEKAEVLIPFLRLICRDKFWVDGRPLDIEFDLFLALSPLVDKYATSTLSNLLFGRHMPSFLPIPNYLTAAPPCSIVIFALAVIHEEFDVARAAIKSLGYFCTPELGACALIPAVGNSGVGMSVGKDWRWDGLEDIPLNLLARMPIRTIHQFAQLHRKVSTRADYNWARAAEEITVGPSRAIFHHPACTDIFAPEQL